MEINYNNFSKVQTCSDFIIFRGVDRMQEIHDIGFIGTGIMGKSMLRNLGKAGYTMHCYARHPQKVEDLKAEGWPSILPLPIWPKPASA